MNHLIKFIILPLIAPVILVALYFTPKPVLGCANRGYLALGLVLASTIIALATTVRFVTEKKRLSETAIWWLGATFILLLPFFLLFGPLK